MLVAARASSASGDAGSAPGRGLHPARHGPRRSPLLLRRRAADVACDRASSDGVLFEQAVSAAPWTLPSVRTILSARGVERAATEDNKLSASVVEAIHKAGYATAAFTEGGFVSKSFGLDLGFDEYFEEEGAVQLVRPDKPHNADARGGIEQTFGRARRWLERHRSDPFFLWIHTYEPHAPHDRSTFTAGLSPAHFGRIFTIETGALLRAARIPFATTTCTISKRSATAGSGVGTVRRSSSSTDAGPRRPRSSSHERSRGRAGRSLPGLQRHDSRTTEPAGPSHSTFARVPVRASGSGADDRHPPDDADLWGGADPAEGAAWCQYARRPRPGRVRGRTSTGPSIPAEAATGTS